ncbi:dihydrodipicolinate synthase family protein [Sphingomonas sp. 37zxx]|uniref:dihydrodipicolinate synthase family protein n=1 Tax=Sphingomonas sp. 37zxx TaxID=1550073 RepID=UPI00053BE410|nr:dihydrodipicolinate synthase family protein [Sphingomonas sp. 37zxx]
MKSSVASVLKGVFPVLPTIFSAGGGIDEDGIRNVVDYVVGAGAQGVVYPGFASEVNDLAPEEREHLVAKVGEWTVGKVPFIVGASATTTELSVRYALGGAKAGASAAMIQSPGNLAGEEQALVGFFRSVGDAVGIPIMLQNAPHSNGAALPAEVIARIVKQAPGVQYIKEETPPCGQRITALLDLVGGSLQGVYGGAGGRYFIDELRRGATGTLPACEITEVHVEMFAAFERGNTKLARELFDRALPLLNMQAVFRWRLTKEVLVQRGLIASPYVRAAGAELDRIDKEELAILLDRIVDLTGLSQPAPMQSVERAR